MNELAIKRDDDDDVLIMWNAWEWKGAQVVSFLISTQLFLILRETRTRYVPRKRFIWILHPIHMIQYKFKSDHVFTCFSELNFH